MRTKVSFNISARTLVRMCNGCLVLLISLAVIRGVGSQAAVAEDMTAEATKDFLRTLKLQTLAAREKLVSGEVWAEGKRTFSHEYATWEQKIRFRVIFDNLTDLYLFDHRIDAPPDWRGAASSYGGREVLHSIFARSGDKTMAFNDVIGIPKIHLQYRDAEVPFESSEMVRYFDPRQCGFVPSQLYARMGGLQENLDSQFGESGRADASFVELDGGVLLLEFRLPVATLTQIGKMWINPDFEHTFLKGELRMSAGVTPNGTEVPERLMSSAEVEWEMRGDVAVPVRWITTRKMRMGATMEEQQKGWPEDLYGEETLQFNFKWVHVNSLPSKDVFDYHSFGMPIGTLVWDNRISPPGVVEIISTETPSPTARLPADRMKFFWWTAAAVAVLISGCYYVINRRRRTFRAS